MPEECCFNRGELSSVPLDPQLAMHVDPDDFLSYIQAVTEAWNDLE